MAGRSRAPKGKARCGCEWLQITDALWLCPHASYGEAAIGAGAVEEARRMMERAGGYAALLDKLHTERTQKLQKERDHAAASRARARSKGEGWRVG